MIYTVIVQAGARADVASIVLDLEEFNSEYADRWASAMEEAIAGLKQFPNRYAFAAETKGTNYEVRQIFVGRYRVLFAVCGDQVHVLRVRHGAQEPLKPGELS
jgi:plasmid stabilization system protein ParE